MARDQLSYFCFYKFLVKFFLAHEVLTTINKFSCDPEAEGRSKPELKILEPRTLARFWNSVLFQAEPRKTMWRCDEIVSFVPSSRKIVTFLEVLKKPFSKPGSVTLNLECDEMWRKCDITSFRHCPSLKPRSRFWKNSGLERPWGSAVRTTHFWFREMGSYPFRK